MGLGSTYLKPWTTWDHYTSPAVQNIVTTATSVNVLTITWDPVAYPILGYQVTVATIDTVVYNTLVTATTTQVPNLVPFTPYYISIVTVAAAFGIGNSTATTAIDFTDQGTPSIAPVTQVNRIAGTMIVVSWESLTLEQARGFVTGYDIQYTPSDSSGPVSATAPSDSSEFTISDLDRTLNYTVSVSAATTAGSGPSSPPVVLQVPGVVQNIATTAPTEDTLIITWDPPTEMSSFTISGYQVRVQTSTATVYDDTVSGTSAQILNLSRYTPYYIAIVVIASAGNSAEATAVAFTLEGTPTIAPPDLQANRISGTMILLSWVSITLEQAQGLIVSYSITYQPSDASGPIQSESAGPDSREFTITGLEASLGYTVSVAAVTTAGSGPSSSVTLQVPGTVQNIATTAPTENMLMISWDLPVEGSSFTITGFQVRVENSTSVVFDDLVPGSQQNVQVSGLARYIPYYISIVVMTASSGSSAEANATAFTLEGTPTAAPSNLTLVRTSGTTMAVSWVPLTLEEAQGFVAGYDISYQPSGSVKRQVQTVRAPGDSSEITITGLDPTVGYSAAVAAATTVGSGPVSPPIASPAACPFQIHFFGADVCEELRSDAVHNDIIQAVVSRTNQVCQCELMDDQITDSSLTCDKDPNAITFRAAMLGNDNANCTVIVNRLEQWVTTADTKLTTQGTELTTNIDCPVSITSFSDEYCDVDVSAAERARVTRIVAPTVVIIVVVVVCVVILIVVAVFLSLRRRRKTTYEVFGDESEVGSINLSEAGAQYKPAGASFKSEKEGIIAFTSGEDSGRVTGTQYQPVGGNVFQNPMYGLVRDREEQPTEPEYAKVNLAAKKQAEAEEEAEIEKMKLEMDASPYEVPGMVVENPYELDPVPPPMTKAQEADYDEIPGMVVENPYEHDPVSRAMTKAEEAGCDDEPK